LIGWAISRAPNKYKQVRYEGENAVFQHMGRSPSKRLEARHYSCIVRKRERGVWRGRYFREDSRSLGRIFICPGVIPCITHVSLRSLGHGLDIFGTFSVDTVWGLGSRVTRDIIVSTAELFVPTVSTSFPAGGVIVIPSS